MNTLITVPFSHFCEKGRWALDWCRVPYVERGFLPGLHLRHTKRIGGRTVPALVRDDGSALTDSTEILRWADAQAIVLPRENRWLDREVAMPAPMRAFIDRLRVTRAGEHAVRCCREHRAG